MKTENTLKKQNMEWIKLEDQMPPTNTLVIVKRFENKIEKEPIYLAMRNGALLSVNPDASANCNWYGDHINKITSQQNSFRELDGFSNFSDVTVKEWAFITIESLT